MKNMPKLASHVTLSKYLEHGANYVDWYEEARQEIMRYSWHYGYTSTRVCDLLALFSPRVAVKRSLRFTHHYLQTGEFSHDVTRSTRAAVDHYEETCIIRGPKTSRFAANLKGDYRFVVLDVWMSKAFNVDQGVFGRKPVYKECSNRVIKVARQYGLTPAATQAGIWAGVVRKAGRNVPRFRLMKKTLFGECFIYEENNNAKRVLTNV
jgi:hypothetical protein